MTISAVDERIREAWRRIETWLRENHPHGADMLAPSAADSNLAALEEGLGYPVPPELRASLRLHDGELAMEGGVPLGLFYAHFLLPAKEALEQWRVIQDVTATWPPGENQAADRIEGIRPYHWGRGWIPVAHNGGGDLFCVDTEPDEGGTYGQVIFVDHEVGPRYIAAAGMAEWLREYAGRIEGGEMYIWTGGSISDEPDPYES